MNRRILCVDDDPNILSALKRALRKDFEIYTAEGAREALQLMRNESEFAVVVSDMQMPGIDGVQFLKSVKEESPDSVRIMLTGNADQQTAIDAVNQGSIFRFLNKPCDPETFANALNAGLEQYRLITAEKLLLNETLNKSLQVLVEVLSMINPTAFSRSNRIKRLAREVGSHLKMANLWEVEVAALLSHIGCVAVPEETLQKIAKCEPLNESELQSYHNYPQVGHDLISRIPRMESIAKMIAHQNHRFNDAVKVDRTDSASLGARILKVVIDFDKLLQTGNLPHQAFKELEARIGWYDQIVLNALKVQIDATIEEFVSVKLSINELKPGMLLDANLYSDRNTLMLSKGQEVTVPLILKLLNLSETGKVSGFIQVSIPISHLQFEDLEKLSGLEVRV